MRRLFIHPLLALLAVSAATVSCRHRASETDPHRLVVGLSASPNTLDPRFATDATGMRISGLLFSSLVRRGQDLRIVGEAAERWTYKDKVYTFYLVPHLRFSDGQPVQASDFEFSFEQFLNERSPFRSSFENLRKVEVRYDDRERWIRLYLSEFNATLLSNLASVKILPRKRVLAAGDDFARQPVGSGPFRLLEQNQNEIQLEAIPAHAYARPRTQKLIFKVIRDDNTRFLKMYKGDLDIAQSELPNAKIATLEKKGDFQIFKYPGLAMTYILLNLRDPILKRLPVRKALSMAIDRQEIIRYKLEGLAQPATSVLTPTNPFFHRELTPTPFDLSAARKALLDAGLEGQTLTLKTSNSQQAIENGRVLAYQLQRAGITVRLQSYEWGTFYGDVKKGNFQMATMRWVGSVDPDIYRTALHSRETPESNGRNRGHYSNPGLDQMLEEGIKIVDESARRRHYMKIQRTVFEDLPYIPLWYDTEVAVVHKRVKGYEPPLNGDFSAFLNAYKE